MSAIPPSKLIHVPGEGVPFPVSLLLAAVGSSLAFAATGLLLPRHPGPVTMVAQAPSRATTPHHRTHRISHPSLARPALTTTRPALATTRPALTAGKAPKDPAPRIQAGTCAPAFDVRFAPGSTTASKGITKRGRRFTTWIHKHPDARVEIRGHADGSGAEYQNFILSRRRAQQVLKALIKLGLDGRRARIRAFGEFNPVSDLASHNRHVEVIVPGVRSCAAKGGTP